MKKINENLYNKIYIQIEAIMKTYDPCRVQYGTCIRGSFCCSGCTYNSGGCVINKHLWCKLWLCDEAIKNIPTKILNKIIKLADKAESNNLLLFR